MIFQSSLDKSIIESVGYHLNIKKLLYKSDGCCDRYYFIVLTTLDNFYNYYLGAYPTHEQAGNIMEDIFTQIKAGENIITFVKDKDVCIHDFSSEKVASINKEISS